MQDAVLPQPAFLTLAGISKRYGGVRALEGVDFACERGKIHAVLGENGAGKSTLTSQLIALRFAPDDEVEELAQNAIAGEIYTRSEIKRAIRNWRSDDLRV